MWGLEEEFSCPCKNQCSDTAKHPSWLQFPVNTLRGWKQAVSAVPLRDNWKNWRTLPSGLQAKKVRSGSALVIASELHFSLTSCRSASGKDEHLPRSAFRMQKTYQSKAFERLWKGFHRTSHPGMTPWDMPTFRLKLKRFIKLFLFGQLQLCENGWELRMTT